MIDWFQELLEFDRWANARVMDYMETLPEPSEQAQKLMAHIMIAREAWLNRCLQRPFSPADSFPLYPLTECRRLNEDIFKRWSDFLSGAGDLSKRITYTTFDGKPYESSLSDILNHVVNHGTYHRGQIAAKVRELGGKPVSTDYIYYTRTKN